MILQISRMYLFYWANTREVHIFRYKDIIRINEAKKKIYVLHSSFYVRKLCSDYSFLWLSTQPIIFEEARRIVRVKEGDFIL